MIKSFKNFIHDESNKRLIANFLSLSLLRGFQLLIPLITLPYLVRTIGIEKFGLVNFALSLGLYFGAFIQFGFGVTATREISRSRDDLDKLTLIYSATLSASIILAIISSFLFVIIVSLVDKFSSYSILYYFTLIFVVFQSLFPIWFFQGMEKMKYIAVMSIGSSSLYLVSLFCFVSQERDFILVPLLHAVASLITLVAAVVFIRVQFKVGYIIPKFKEVKDVYRNGYHAFISQLAPTLYNNSSVFLLGLFSGNTLVGLYSSAIKIVDALLSIAYVLSSAFLPYLSRNLKKHEFFKKTMLFSSILLTIFMLAAAEWIASVLFGDEGPQIATYIKWLTVSVFFVFASIVYGTNFLMLIGKDKVVKNITLFASFVFFIIALIAIPAWGVWGAISTLLGARFTIAVAQYFYYIKYREWLV